MAESISQDRRLGCDGNTFHDVYTTRPALDYQTKRSLFQFRWYNFRDRLRTTLLYGCSNTASDCELQPMKLRIFQGHTRVGVTLLGVDSQVFSLPSLPSNDYPRTYRLLT